MALLPTQNVTPTGLTPAFVTAAAGGDTCATGKQNCLVVKNASGSPVTVTILTFPDVTSYGATIPDLIVSVPATTGERWIGPFQDVTFASPADGLVHIGYSAVTSVTVGVFAI